MRMEIFRVCVLDHDGNLSSSKYLGPAITLIKAPRICYPWHCAKRLVAKSGLSEFDVLCRQA